MSKVMIEKGKRFGKLVIQKLVVNGDANHRKYLCECDCGNEEFDIFTQTDWDGETEYVVMCQHCKTISTGPTKEKAISDWNRAINLKSFME